jgi:hypothetical protein
MPNVRNASPLLLLVVVVTLQLDSPSGFSQEATSPAQKGAQESFLALKNGRIDQYIAYFHPDDLVDFSKLIIDLATLAENSKDANAKPFANQLGKPSDLKQMKPEDVTKTFIQMMVKQDPAFAQTLTKTDQRVLGEVSDGKDKTVIVYQTAFLPRAAVTEKYKDVWRMRLDPSLQEMASLLKEMLAGNLQNPQDVLRKTLGKDIESVRVIGSIPEGNNRTHVVYDSVLLPGKEKSKAMVVSLTNKDEEWSLLGADQRPRLEAALLKRLQKSLQLQKDLIKQQLEILQKLPDKGK